MGDWMAVNSEGIYDSSAWDVWGEGKIEMSSGNLGPAQAATPYTARDIRFTARNGSVYAWLMTWPAEGNTVIRSLAAGAGKISRVELLGSPEPLEWEQSAAGLVVKLPAKKPCRFAFGLKITGENLHPAGAKKS